MENNHIVDLIPAYLDGHLSEEETKKFESHIEGCEDCKKETEEYKVFFEAMNREQNMKPSDNLRTNFERLLEEEKDNQVKVVSITSKPKNGIFQFLKVAASVALLISAFFLGKNAQKNEFQNEFAALEEQTVEIKQTAMISLLENQSASKRIQGVQYINDFINPDESIIMALADRMLNDENTNVRLSAMEALANFKNSEIVKEAFIQALKTENDPSIQIAIIQNLVEIQEKKAIGPMQDLLEQESTQPFIKDEITNAIPKII